jgi:translation initiation factor eIF-2B subunit beta
VVVGAHAVRAVRVLVRAHTVLGDGSVVAHVGMHMVALPVMKHAVPFVVLVGLHKLSP